MDLVWTALVTIAALSTCVLVYIAADPGWGIREYSPILQAVLSAGAIFSAWLLQDMKRRADRADTTTDTVVAVKAMLDQAELTVAKLIAAGHIEVALPAIKWLTASILDNVVIVLRQQKTASLPNTEAVQAFTAAFFQITLINSILLTSDRKQVSTIGIAQLAIFYKELHGSISEFYYAAGLTSRSKRPPVTLPDLKAWWEAQAGSDDDLAPITPSPA